MRFLWLHALQRLHTLRWRPAARQRAGSGHCAQQRAPIVACAQQRARIEELEPRLLYSADNPFAAVSAALLPAAVVQVVPAATPHLQTVAAVQAVQSAPTPPVAPSRELVFVDAGVAPTQVLIDGLLASRPAGVQLSVVLLQAGTDGLQQISDTLAQHHNLAAVHIVAHGEQAALQLGSTKLDAAAMASRSAELQAWRTALSGDADLLLYACDVAAGDAGANFIERLAGLTGADVAASTNTTGAAALGGDWVLEAQVGTVTAQAATLPLQQAYAGVLGLVPSGGEVRVNGDATGSQSTSAYGGGNVAMDSAGNHVVVWNDLRTNSGDIYFQRYDAAGVAQGGNVLVNTTTTGLQAEAQVAMDNSGNFVIVWQSASGDGNGIGVMGQRYDASGTAQGGEFVVNTQTFGDQVTPAVAVSGSGAFIVAFADNGTGIISARHYDASGVPLGNQFSVSTSMAGGRGQPSAAMDADGDFVIVWQSSHNGTDDIFGRQYDASGAAQGGEFGVNTTTTDGQTNASVAMDSSGNFVVAWESSNQDPGGTAGIYSQRYNAAGAAQGSEFRVNTTTSNAQTTPAVAMNTTGGFVVSWTSGGGLDGSGDGVYAQAYDAAGTALGGELRVATSSSGDQQFPAVAHTGSRAIVAWAGNGSGDTQGVYAQAFSVTAFNQVAVDSTSDVADGNTSSIDALVGDKGADGVISLREAITAANNTPNAVGADRIVFNIPGTGTHTVTPGTALPTITGPLSIFGSTESDWVAGSFLPIVLDGDNLAGDGLTFAAAAAGSSLRGLVVRDFGGQGVLVQSGADGFLLAGNFIGAFNSDGSVAAASEANAGGGVRLLSDFNTVGGVAVTERNVIGGNGIRGVQVVGDGNTVQGNYFGVAADGSTASSNASSNLHITGNNNLVGGTSAAATNLLANSNSWHGINLVSGTGNSFLGNTTSGNALLGIDLGDDGVTSNDAGDADSGANNLQNFPLLATARTDGAGALVLAGTLNSSASSHYRVEFFANTSQDSSGFGEGQTYLGFANVSTDGSGNGAISTTLNVTVPVGRFISATATASNAAFNTFSSTSELARNVATVSSTQAVVTVDTSSDVNDGDTTSISTLLADKGADGLVSLREAMAAANNTSNGSSPDRITFNIAGAGVHTITVSTALPTLTDAVVLDGYSQTGASANTLAVGNDAVLHVNLRGPGSGGAAFDGLTLGAGSSGSTVSGLVIGNFNGAGVEVVSGSNTFTGNWVGLNSSGTAADANVAAGLRINGAGSNVIGGATPAARNVFSGNTIEGIYLYNGAANTVQGNYIGTNAAGTAAVANSAGLQIHSGTGSNQIGGTLAGEGNLISGNTAEGVQLRSGAGSNVLRGNTIGLDAAGTVALPNTHGIWLDTGANNNRIGGVNAADANTIAGNSGTGIVAYLSTGGSASGNAVLRNAISGNGSLAIDLSSSAVGGDGATANDNGDGDAGPNGLQNFPVLGTAVSSGGNTTITGTFRSNGSTSYRIEFFSAATADASGHGEAPTWLGSTTVTTNGGGIVAINTTLTGVVVPVGHAVSATATVDLGGGNFGSTSELAANILSSTVGPAITVGAISGNTSEAGASASFTVVLNTAPTADVSIPVASGNALEGNVTSAATLLFTPANWAIAQTVTVTGVDETLDDGDRAYTVLLGAATSVDGGYSGLDAADVAATNTDNDTQNTVVVTTTSDSADGDTSSLYNLLADPGVDGQISLREAITASNNTSNGSGGADRIHFGISGTGVHTLNVGSALPAITGAVLLDATTDDSYAVNSNRPAIVLDGNDGAFDGLVMAATADGSTISGLLVRDFGGHALWLQAGSDGHTVSGNYFGALDSTGAAAPGEGTGLAALLLEGSGSTIGGTGAAAANRIAGSADAGIEVTGGTGNALLGNLITANTGLGIDLGNPGVTPNDGGDADSGANNLQNFPVLATARTDGTAQLVLTGSLSSAASTPYRVEFFASSAAHSSGHGEGQRFLGFEHVTTDGAGLATFNTTLAVVVAAGESISATATRANVGHTVFSDTSEFALNTPATMAPVLGASGSTLAYTENDAATAVDAALTVSDGDSANLSSATVSISANFASGQDVLAFSDQLGITGSWNAGTGALTLSGISTVANYQTALQSVTYSNSSDNPSTLLRTVSFVVDDGVAPSATATRSISVTAVNDAPAITTSGSTLVVTENDAATAIDPALTVADPDHSNLSGATVTISVNYANGEDELLFTNQLGISGSWNAGTGVLTLSGSTTVGNYQAALRTVSYLNSSEAPDTTLRSISFDASDGAATGTAASRSLQVNAVNDAPVLDNTASMVLSTIARSNSNPPGNTVAQVIGSVGGDRITDVDSNALEGVAVTAVSTGGIGNWQYSLDGGSNWILLSGMTPSSALLLRDTDVVRFVPSGAANGQATFTFRAWDQSTGSAGTLVNASSGGASSPFSAAFETATINVVENVARPTAVADNAQTPVGTPVLVNVLTNDLDPQGDPLVVLDISTPASGTVSDGGGGNLTYTPNGGFSGSDGFNYLIVDGNEGLTHFHRLDGSATDSVGGNHGTLVNGPTTVPGAYGQALQFDGVDDHVALPDFNYSNEFTLSFRFRVDDNSGSEIQYFYSHGVLPSSGQRHMVHVALVEASNATVGQRNQIITTIVDSNDINDANGQLLTPAAALIGDGLWHQYTATVTPGIGLRVYIDGTLRGSVFRGGDAIDPAGTAMLGARSDLDPTRFLNAGSRLDSLAVFNHALSAAEVSDFYTGGSVQGTVTVAVNAAPVVATSGGSNSHTENGAATVLDAGLTVTDANSATLAGATVTISTNYALGQDQLLFSNQAGITGSWNAGTGVLTLSGSASVANYQAALRSVTYINGSEAPSTAVRELTFVVTDGLVSSTAATRNLNVVAVNDAPTASNLNAAESYTEDTPLNLTDIVASDVDSSSGSATLTLSNAAAGTLSTGTAGAVTATYNAGTGVWTASGLLADVNTLLAGVTFTPALNFNGSFNISTSVSDGVAAPVTGSKAFTGVAVNDVPAVALPASLNALEDSTTALVGLSISDPDAGSSNLRAELTVTGGSLAASSTGGVTVAGSGSSTLVLTGTLADLNNFLAGASPPSYTPAANASGNFTLAFVAADGMNSGTGGVLAPNQLDFQFQDGSPPSGPVQSGVATAFDPNALAVGYTGSGGSYGVNYSGVLNITTAGVYSFTVAADDSASLWLDGSQVLLAFFGNASASVGLAAGAHSLELRFFQDFGGAGLTASYSGTDTGTVSTPLLSAPGVGRLVSTTANSSITVAAVNDAPTASNLNAAESYTEDTPLNLTDIVVADIDSANVTATLTLSNSAAGALSTATAGSVTSTYNAGTGVWAASGPLADVNTLVAGVVFTPSANFNGAFAVATSVSDFVAAAMTGSKNFTGVPVNDAPTASNLFAAETYTEDTVLNLADIVAADIDSSSGSVTLVLSSPAAGLLGTGTSGAVTSSYNPATGTWQASGAWADINVLLAALAFTPTPDFNGAFSIGTSVSDFVAAPVVGVKTFSGVPVNDAPTASNLSAAESNAEDQPLNLVDIVVGDIDSANVTARLVLSNPAAGSFNAGTSGGVTASYNAATGTWQASGALADVNSLLQALSFTPALNFNGALTVATHVDDGVAAPLLGSKALTVLPVNDAPTASNLNTAETYTEDTALNLVDISITDVDHSTGSATLTLLNPAAGVFSTGSAGAVLAIYNAATGVWQASGALVDVNTLLAGLVFTPAAHFNGSFSVATSVSDGVAAPVLGSKLFTGVAVNDAPTATQLNTAEGYVEDQALNLTDIVVSDLDSASVSARLTLSNAAAGSLSTATAGAVTSSYNAITGVWLASGALTDVNMLLAGVTYLPAADFNGSFSISTRVDDGVAPALAGSKNFTGTAVNDAPTASGLNTAEVYTEDTVLNLANLVVADIDSPVLQVSLTLSNPDAGTLNTPSVGGVASTFDTSTGTWFASGPTADVNAVLAAVQFTPTLNFNGAFALASSVSDGVAAPVTGSKPYTGVAVNDTPVLGPVGNVALAEGGVFTLGSAQLQASDVDHSAAQLVYTVLTAPAHGALWRSGVALAAGGTFTQAELDAGLVELRHNSSENFVDNFAFSLSDGQASVAAGPLAITAWAVNDEVPAFTSPSAGISLGVAENTVAVTQATAADADLPAQTLQYSVAGGADAAFFSINSTTGQLQFIQAPDHETPLDADGDNSYQVSLQVSDGLLASTRAVVVTVLPENDNTPQLVSGGGGAQALVELQEGNLAVTTVRAQDADRPVQTLRYAIVGGADAARFVLDAGSGALRFVEPPMAIAPRDSDRDNRYDVVVQASDGSRVVQQALRVQVRATLAAGLPDTPPAPSETSTLPTLYTGGDRVPETAATGALQWTDQRPMVPGEEETASWTSNNTARRSSAFVRLADSAGSRSAETPAAAAFVLAAADTATGPDSGPHSAVQKPASDADTPSLEAALGLPTADPGLLQARPGGLSLAALAAQTAARSSTAVPGQLLPAQMQGDNAGSEDDGSSAIEALAAPVVAGGVAFSATLLVWATRAGGLAAAMMASVPAWRSLDPLPILERSNRPAGDEDADAAGPATAALADAPPAPADWPPEPDPTATDPNQAPVRELLVPLEMLR